MVTNTGIGTSLMLIALGAILALAVNVQATGIDIQTIGVILIVIGIMGLLFSLLFLSNAGPFYRSGASHGHGTVETVYRETAMREPSSQSTEVHVHDTPRAGEEVVRREEVRRTPPTMT